MFGFTRINFFAFEIEEALDEKGFPKK